MKNNIQINRSKLIGCAVLFVTTMFLIQPALGFAGSYQATTDVTGNTIDVDYFTVGIYENDSPTDDFLSDSIQYRKNLTSGNYTYDISGKTITRSGLSLRITEKNTPQSAVSYEISATSVCKYAKEDGTIIADTSSSLVVTLTDGVNTYSFMTNAAQGEMPSSVIVTGTNYGLSIDATVSSTTLPSKLSVSLIFTVEATYSGVYQSSTNVKTITLDDSVSITTIEEAIAAIMNLNPDLFGEGSDKYGLIESEGSEIELGGGKHVFALKLGSNASENDSIVNGDGQVHMSLNLPGGVYFVIRCYHNDTSYNALNAKVTVTGDVSYESPTFNVYDDFYGKNIMVVRYGSSLAAYSFDENTLKNDPSKWIEGDTISVSLQSTGTLPEDDIMFEILLWPTDVPRSSSD